MRMFGFLHKHQSVVNRVRNTYRRVYLTITSQGDVKILHGDSRKAQTKNTQTRIEYVPLMRAVHLRFNHPRKNLPTLSVVTRPRVPVVNLCSASAQCVVRVFYTNTPITGGNRLLVVARGQKSQGRPS